MPMHKKIALIDFGLELLANSLGFPAISFRPQLPPSGKIDWDRYSREITSSPGTPTVPMRSILSIVNLGQLKQNEGNDSQRWYRPAPLQLEKSVIMPLDFQQATEENDQSRSKLTSELAKLKQLSDVHDAFDKFYHLFMKYGWTIPCSCGESGIPLFQQWKAISATVFASGTDWELGPDNAFSLIGGDIPGIQDFVYTITSKGAAKGLRGRSMFIQLLNAVIVERIIAELDLSIANIIYNAGGNFMILGSSLDQTRNGQSVNDLLHGIQSAIDEALLKTLGGDLSLCMAWQDIERSIIGSAKFAMETGILKQKIALGKRQRFLSLLPEHWQSVFGPQGKPGNQYCAICQRPIGRNNGISHGEAVICEPCDGFRLLAEAIGRRDSIFLNFSSQQSEKGENWQKILYDVGNVWVEFSSHPISGGRSLLLNHTDFLERNASGFLFLANVTPRVTKEDVLRWQTQRRENDDEKPPRIGSIRSFEEMADAARGVKKIGVLRMDVDNLGQIMVHGLSKRTMMATSTLSSMMDLFFSGWVNEICRDVNQLDRKDEKGVDRGDRLYIIYAGGDDLFVLGAWDLIPELAQRIHDDFQAFVGENPSITISGGITLENKKFPLYQAAERAGEAEEAAKSYQLKGKGKDAIQFLGLTLKWNEWPIVLSRRDMMMSLLSDRNERGTPKALLRVVQNIFAQYESQRIIEHHRLRNANQLVPADPDQYVYFGPWMWREAYTLTRMAKKMPSADKKLIEELQVGSIDPITIRHSGLAARWTELLLRKEA